MAVVPEAGNEQVVTSLGNAAPGAISEPVELHVSETVVFGSFGVAPDDANQPPPILEESSEVPNAITEPGVVDKLSSPEYVETTHDDSSEVDSSAMIDGPVSGVSSFLEEPLSPVDDDSMFSVNQEITASPNSPIRVTFKVIYNETPINKNLIHCSSPPGED